MSVSVELFPVAEYAGGIYTVPSTAVADAVERVEVSVRRCTSADPTIWPSTSASITFDFQYSLDGGNTWFQWFNASDVGGLVVSNKTGLEIPAMYFNQSLPAGTGRRVRGTITLSESIKTSGQLTVT